MHLISFGLFLHLISKQINKRMQLALTERQDIVNYQLNIIQQSSKNIIWPITSETNKYEAWTLQQKLNDLAQSKITRWIGNHQIAYLEAYAYVLLLGSLQVENCFIKLKGLLYSTAIKCLDFTEQKLLVQFLCLIQFSKDKHGFLKKNSYIQQILIKILQFLEGTIKQSENNINNNKIQISQIYIKPIITKSLSTFRSEVGESTQCKKISSIYNNFSKYFSFMTCEEYQQSGFIFKMFYSYHSYALYILIEKECFFIIQPTQEGNSSHLANQQSPAYLNCSKSIKSSLKNKYFETFDPDQFNQIFDISVPKQIKTESLKSHQQLHNQLLSEETQIIRDTIKKSPRNLQNSKPFSKFNSNKINSFYNARVKTESDQSSPIQLVKEINFTTFDFRQSNKNCFLQKKIDIKSQEKTINLQKKEKKIKLKEEIQEKQRFFRKMKGDLEQFRKKIDSSLQKSEKFIKREKYSKNQKESQHFSTNNLVQSKTMNLSMSLKDLRIQKDVNFHSDNYLIPEEEEHACENEESFIHQCNTPKFTYPSEEHHQQKLEQKSPKKRNFEWLKNTKLLVEKNKQKKEQINSKNPNANNNINFNLSLKIENSYFSKYQLSNCNSSQSLMSSQLSPLKKIDKQAHSPPHFRKNLQSFASLHAFSNPVSLRNSLSRNSKLNNLIRFS